MVERFERFSVAIAEISRCWHKLAGEEMKAYGLKGAHAAYLVIIGRHPQGITVPELCEQCMKYKSDASRMLAILEEKAAQGVEVPCEVDVLFTDDVGIHAINLEQREVDRPTDVLSFPMFEFIPGQPPTDDADADPETGLVPLGDMVLSLERARAQGEEYGHGTEREVAYLAVHSVLHLLGYDHMDEGPMKAQMREREEAILSRLGIGRDV